MIPKIIHYCWFGRGRKPEEAIKCINSWNKYLPEYEIKEWNEDNFDVYKFPYAKEALENRKFAFVTDVVRLYVLYTEGGIYMDTDVEVLKPLDRFLVHHAFSGFESDTGVPTGIMGAEKGSLWAKENLDYYSQNRHFVMEDGTLDITTNVKIITDYMVSKGLSLDNNYQDFPDLITMYPKDFFSPKSWRTGKICCTENTHTIHHFAGSWESNKKKIQQKLVRPIAALIGDKGYDFFRNLIKKDK